MALVEEVVELQLKIAMAKFVLDFDVAGPGMAFLGG